MTQAKPTGTQITVMGLDARLVDELTSSETRAGYFVSFDLAHFDRLEAQDKKGRPNAKGKFLNAVRQKLWRDLRQLGCPKITQSFYRIPEGVSSYIPDGVKVHDDMTRLEAVEAVFANIGTKFEAHGFRDSDLNVLIAPLVTTVEKWEQIHASAMDNVLTFLQRKITKLGELDAKTLERADVQAFTSTRNEIFEILRMVENTKELKDSDQKSDYDAAITLAQELINSVGSKIKTTRAKRGTVAN